MLGDHPGYYIGGEITLISEGNTSPRWVEVSKELFENCFEEVLGEMNRANAVHEGIGEELQSLGGYLMCTQCGKKLKKNAEGVYFCPNYKKHDKTVKVMIRSGIFLMYFRVFLLYCAVYKLPIVYLLQIAYRQHIGYCQYEYNITEPNEKITP